MSDLSDMFGYGISLSVADAMHSRDHETVKSNLDMFTLTDLRFSAYSLTVGASGFNHNSFTPEVLDPEFQATYNIVFLTNLLKDLDFLKSLMRPNVNFGKVKKALKLILDDEINLLFTRDPKPVQLWGLTEADYKYLYAYVSYQQLRAFTDDSLNFAPVEYDILNSGSSEEPAFDKVLTYFRVLLYRVTQSLQP